MTENDKQKMLNKLAVAEKALEDQRNKLGDLNKEMDLQYEYIEYCTINLAKANSELTNIRNKYFKMMAEFNRLLQKYRIELTFLKIDR